jgi:hypothetical protein
VTLTDSLGNSTTSPIWSFSTAGNTAPVASNHVLTVLGDAPTNLALTASDINGDPLTYRTNSLPQHGLNSNFNPAAGTLTFSPIRGYRGSDRFTYSASDGYATSSVVTMNLTIIAPADTNANGLPDAWESAYGVTDPNGDNDNDGRSNLDEYSAGTNPTNAVSVLQISGATVAANGHVTLSWASVGGVRYRIQYSNGNIQGPYLDIIRPLGLEMDPASYNTASSRVFVDDFSLTGGPPVAASRYYRIKVVQ